MFTLATVNDYSQDQESEADAEGVRLMLGARLEVGVEGPLPRPGVNAGRVRDHPVEVEDNSVTGFPGKNACASVVKHSLPVSFHL